MSWPWIVLFGLQWVAIAALLVIVLGLNQRVVSLISARNSNSDGLPPRRLLGDLPTIGRSLAADSPLRDLGSGNRIFVFVSSGCPPCRNLGTKLAVDPSETLRALNEASLLVLTDADGEPIYSIPGVTTTVFDDGAIRSAVGIQATPTAIAVDSSGVVRGTNIPASLDDIGDLAGQLTGAAALTAPAAVA